MKKLRNMIRKVRTNWKTFFDVCQCWVEGETYRK